MTMSCGKRKGCSLSLIIAGITVTVAILVCILLGAFQDLIKSTVEKSVELKEGSETFKNWKSPSSEVYMQYFMFNLTNPSDVKNGSKPSVNQTGPYSYREIRHNSPRYLNHSANTIAYFSEKAYVFDPATSCSGCDPLVDKIHTINIPFLKISQLLAKGLKNISNFVPKVFVPVIEEKINKFLESKEQVFHERSVHDLLWGYEDSLLISLHNFTQYLDEQFKEHGLKLHIPPVNPIVKLQNNNTNVSAEIYTGVGNINRLGEYVSYNNFRTLPWWHTKWANMINGTDASMFRPYISKDDNLQTFVSDICRSLYVKYYSTTEVRGITLWKYFVPPEVFKYTAAVRAGFCLPDNLTCVPDGLLDISVCQPMNVPIVVSLPHFLFANETVIQSVDGMHPNEKDHSTFVSVEPYTGITMKANKRIQINVAVDKVEGITQFEKLRKVFLPVLFVNESGCIDEDSAEKFKKQVYLPMNILKIGKYVVVGIGCLLIVLGLFLLPRKRSEPAVQSHAVNDGEHDKTPLCQPQNYVT